jgi:hypothetical protein
MKSFFLGALAGDASAAADFAAELGVSCMVQGARRYPAVQ